MGILQSWARLLGGEVRGDAVVCPGPGHSPKDRSLSVKVGKDGEPICFSHCGDDPFVCKDFARSLLGFPKFGSSNSKAIATGKAAERGSASPALPTSPRKIYEFRDPATGAVRYRKERIESHDGSKSFAFKPAGRNGSEPLLYGGERLADMSEGQPVFVVEGEKKVDRLFELGSIAVSLDNGASSKWLTSHADALRGLNIVLWPDSDDPGEKYVAAAAACIKDVAASIKIVRPFGLPNGVKGRDVCDWSGDLSALIASAETYSTDLQITVFKNGDDLFMETIEWLWLHWIAKGKLHLIAGAPEAGKTTLALMFAATISAGERWPDGRKAPVGNVVMWTSEDNLADTIKPRLVRMGADLTRIKFIVGQRDADGKTRPFNPSIDMASLAESVARLNGGVQLLIIDPIVAAIGSKTNSHNNAETRNSLQPVVDFAETASCAVLGISHFTKGTGGKDPVERITGSLAFGALPRIVFAASKSDEGNNQRIFVRAKSNIGPSGGGFGYELEAATLMERPDIIATRVVWGEPLEGTAKELLDDAEPQTESRGSRKRDAELFLTAILQGGQKKFQAMILEEARANGISEETLKRAKKSLGVKSSQAQGKWLWSLC
jgi:hypothetical protein